MQRALTSRSNCPSMSKKRRPYSEPKSFLWLFPFFLLASAWVLSISWIFQEAQEWHRMKESLVDCKWLVTLFFPRRCHIDLCSTRAGLNWYLSSECGRVHTSEESCIAIYSLPYQMLFLDEYPRRWRILWSMLQEMRQLRLSKKGTNSVQLPLAQVSFGRRTFIHFSML